MVPKPLDGNDSLSSCFLHSDTSEGDEGDTSAVFLLLRDGHLLRGDHTRLDKALIEILCIPHIVLDDTIAGEHEVVADDIGNRSSEGGDTL